MAFDRPDVFIEEVPQLEGPVTPTATGFGGLQGVTQKGPAGTVTRVRNFPDWKRIYGDREVRSDMAYEAKMFFDEGGVELITSRSVAFTDVDDPDSFVGGVASAATNGGTGIATAAIKAASTAPYELDPADTFTIDVDNVGTAAIVFDADAGVLTGSGLSISDLTGLTILLGIDGGSTQTITFSGSESTVELAVQTINAQLSGGFAEVSGGQVRITSDVQGTDSEVDITGGTALSELGLSATSDSGAGDVANIAAVTAAEFKTVVEADTTATVSLVGNIPTISSPTTGVTSELDFTGTDLAKFGLSVEVINGTAAGGVELTLTLSSGFHGTQSPGIRGNELSKQITRTPLHPSAGAGSDLLTAAGVGATEIRINTLSGINEKSVLQLDDGSNTEYVEVLQTRADVVAGVVQFFVELTAPLANAFATGNTTIESREFDVDIYDGTSLVESFTFLSMLDTADNYVETILNDENTGSEFVVAVDEDSSGGIGADLPLPDTALVAFTSGTDETLGLDDADIIGSATGGTGFHAYDNVREFMSWATPGQNSAAVVHAASQYAKSRIYMTYIAYTDIGISASAAVSYRENTLGLNSDFVFLYGGGAKMFDPEGSGSAPRRLITAVGGIQGLYARVDALAPPAGGPWNAPAGEGDFGALRSALDVATVYNDSDHEILNKASVNTIRKFGNTGSVLVFGARTLDSTVSHKFRYINVRRFFQFVEKSVADSTRFAIFRNNDFRLWGRLEDAVDDFLTGLLGDGAFPTSDKSKAFFVNVGIPKGTMTQGDIDAGRVIGEIGLAPQKPAEFVIWRFTQFDGGSLVVEDAEEA